MFERYVINFGQMSLEEAERWPNSLAIVREKVKPERDRNNRDVRRIYWWRFGEVAPALYAAIAPLVRCLVTARVTKHLCFSFQPTNRVLNEKLYVFPFDDYVHFAALQSRVHVAWAWFLSSTMKNDLNYSASDCFETFPFPDPLTPAMEHAGQRLYETRAAYMKTHQRGLTETYNRLKDPDNHDAEIEELRRLSEDVDRAVLDAYGWRDIEVPPFAAKEGDPVRARFEDEVIDRLFALNAERAEKERILGASATGAKGAKKTKAAPKRKKKGEAPDQGGLPGMG